MLRSLNIKTKGRMAMGLGAIFLSLLIVPNHTILAEVICTGPGCSLIPQSVSSQFPVLDQNIRTQFLNPEMNSMAEAATLANINSAMMGTGTVNRFQIGAGVTAAGVKNADIQVYSPGFHLPKFPNVGAAASPSVMAAVNLGFLLGNGESENDDSSQRTFWHRISIFAHGMSGRMGTKDISRFNKDHSVTLNASDYAWGATVRFQLIRDYNTAWGFLKFTGLNLGVGFNQQRQAIDVFYKKKNSPGDSITFGPVTGLWQGGYSVHYNSTVQSVPIDIRTGVRLFYFMTLFGGVGYSSNNGNSTMVLSRTGPVSLTLNASSLPANIPPQYSALYSGTLQNPSINANLSIIQKGYGLVPSDMRYGIFGVQFNFSAVKILVEAMASKHMYSGNVGVKFAL